MSFANSKKFTFKILLLSGLINRRDAQIFLCTCQGEWRHQQLKYSLLENCNCPLILKCNPLPILATVSLYLCRMRGSAALASSSVVVVKGDYKYMA
jgi:hypothetical protein